MHAATIAKTYFVLGRMHIHIDQRRIQFQIQNKGRMTAIEQHIAVGLSHRMSDQAVTDVATVDVEMLQICLTPGEAGQGYPTPQPQTNGLALDKQRIFHKRRAANCRQTALLLELTLRRFQAVNRPSVVAQRKADFKATQGLPLDDLIEMAELGFFST